MKRHLRPLAGLAFVILVTGCSSDDTPTAPGAGRTVKANPSFAGDIQEIFERRGCTGSNCHGQAQSAGLDLRASSSYGELVNVAAFQDGTKDRVTPNDASNSYLVIKLEGRQTVGDQMPVGGQPLDSIDITNIKNWINQGALDN